MAEAIFKDVTEALTDLKELSAAGDSQDASMCVVVLISETKKLLTHCSENKELNWLEKVYEPVITAKFRALVDQAKVLSKDSAPPLVKAVKEMETTIREMMEGIRDPSKGPPEYREAMTRGSEVVRLLKGHMVASIKKAGAVEKNLMKSVMELKELLGLWFKSKTLKNLLPNFKDRFLQLLGDLAKLSQKLDTNTKKEGELEEKGSPADKKAFAKQQTADYNSFYETITKLGDTLEEWLGNQFGLKLNPSPNSLYEVKSSCLAKLRGEDVPESAFTETGGEAASAPGFKETKMEDYKDAFDTFRGEAAAIPIKLLGDVVRVFGFNPTQEEIKTYTAELGKSELDFDAMLQVLKDGETKFTSIDVNDILSAFMQYDRSDLGYITSGQFKDILSMNLAEPLAADDVTALYERLGCNTDPDADINYLIEIASSIVYCPTL